MLNISRRTFLGTAGATLGAMGATTAGILLDPADAHAAPIPNRSGLAWRSGCATDDASPATFEQFRGRKIDLRTGFWRYDTWAGMRALDGLKNKLYPRGTAGKEMLAMCYYPFPTQQSPKNGGMAVWQMAARGNFDEHHRVIARAISNYQGPFLFRIGHEWNGAAYPWGGVSNVAVAPYYIAYFRRIVDILRSANPTCLIDWCCLKRNAAPFAIQSFYPGDNWVDFIGHDRYDRYPTFKTQADWDRRYMELDQYGSPVGIGAWLAYAKSKRKKLSIAEWGTANTSEGGSGDNPFFIEKMLKFFKANAAEIGYECYFNRRTGLGGHHLSDCPRAGAKYKQLMASGGV